MNSHMLNLHLNAPGIITMICYVGVYLLWTGAYAFIITHARKTRRVGMPLACASMMWGYETAFLLLYTPQNAFWAAMEVPWWILDTVLVVQVWMYSHRTSHIFVFRRHPALATASVVLLMTAGIVALVGYFDLTDGIIAALLVTTFVSVLMALYVQLVDYRWVSWEGQLARSLADLSSLAALMIAFPFRLEIPRTPDGSYFNLFTLFLALLMVGCDVFTVAYITVPRYRRWRWLRSAADGVPLPELEPHWHEPGTLVGYRDAEDEGSDEDDEVVAPDAGAVGAAPPERPGERWGTHPPRAARLRMRKY